LLKKNQAEVAGLVVRLHQQGTDKDIRPARLSHDGAAKGIMLLLEHHHAIGERTASQNRTTREHQACRFAAGMGVEDLDTLHSGRRR
jgi:hypothetical protein